MRIHKALLMLALAAIVVGGTGAQDEVYKLGVVDIDQAISSTEEGKAAREEFARKQREAEARVQPLLERYKEMEADFKAKKFVLSEDALFQRQLDLVELRNSIQSRLKEIEGQLEVDRKRLEGPLSAKLVVIVEEIGKGEGFTMIMRRGAPGILYTREALDITDLVIQNYNRKS